MHLWGLTLVYRVIRQKVRFSLPTYLQYEAGFVHCCVVFGEGIHLSD